MSRGTVLALDPGRTTGYAKGVLQGGELVVTDIGQEKWSVRGLFDMLENAAPQYLVVESFEYRPKYRAEDRLDLYPCYLIGVSCLWTDLRGIRIFLQSASYADAYYTDTKLRKDGVFGVARPHGNDAVRHLLTWYTFGAGYKHNKRGYRGQLPDHVTTRKKPVRKAQSRRVPKGEIDL